MARHDPLVILGFLLIGAFSVLFVHIQFKMREAGYRTYPLVSRPSDWRLPAEYLRIAKKRGWSPWPVYLMWPCLIVGIVLLIVGVSRLSD
jgi:hypothetical protein